MTKSRHGREDLVGRLRPDEGLRVGVGELDVPQDGSFQFPRAAVHTAAQLLVRQGREPALYEIDPRTARRREVDVEARVPSQPAMDQRGLVRAGIVYNEVDIERCRHGVVNGVQEPTEFPGAVALVELAD